jgi:phage major head subunit gpT-like protein
MQINQTTIADLYKGFRTIFVDAMQGAAPQYAAIAMRVPSKSGIEIYHWLSALPGMKEFVGQAQIDNAGANKFQIANKKWHDTLGVKREDIERDNIGIYNPLMASIGVAAAEHPDELIADLLTGGFTQKDYTGKNFFDTNKPHNPDDNKAGVFSNKGTKKFSADNFAAAKASVKSLKNGAGRPMGLGRKLLLVVSPKNEDAARKVLKADLVNQGETNVQKDSADLLVLNRLGDSDAWFLLEVGLPFKALVFQEEVPVKLNSLTKVDDSYVLLNDQFLFQAYGRYNAGYGLPQLIWGSTGADAA